MDIKYRSVYRCSKNCKKEAFDRANIMQFMRRSRALEISLTFYIQNKSTEMIENSINKPER